MKKAIKEITEIFFEDCFGKGFLWGMMASGVMFLIMDELYK